MVELEPKKKRIIEELEGGPKSSTELLESVKEGENSMSKDTLYKHLKELELMGVIQSKHDNSKTPPRKYYNIADEKSKKKFQKIQSRPRSFESVLDITKMEWLREKIDKINSINAQIQRTFSSRPSLFNRRNSKLEKLFENFDMESLQAVRDMQGKYPEFDFKHEGSTFFKEAYHNYDWFRKQVLDWHKGRGFVGKIRKDVNCELVGDVEPAVEAAHDFASHLSKFFVDWLKYSRK